MVTVKNAEGGTITTSGHDASGIVAHSIGGTGGSGGFAAGLDLVSFGGNASEGGNGDTVTINNAATIKTGIDPSSRATSSEAVCVEGCSHGIVAQSVGGGGGVAGTSGGWFSIGGSATQAAGGAGGVVNFTNTGDITTNLVDSSAIIAQSIGGGGGIGGSSGSLGAVASMAIGGSGGDGGAGSNVTVNNKDIAASTIKTLGDRSHGILAQSIGGGGGHGGFSGAVAVAVDVPSVAATVGGTGAKGSKAGSATVFANGKVSTAGADSSAVVAQSIGGGGGNGGFDFSASASDEGAFSVSIGGSAGDAGTASVAKIESFADVETSGKRSAGLKAQSIGGSGGNGGLAISVEASDDSPEASMTVGGGGGTGGTASEASVISSGSVNTTESDAEGILAQSVGGSGGRGGMAISGSLEIGDGEQLGVAIGGTGGSGGNSVNDTTSNLAASVTTTNTVKTAGDRSTGIIAQSIGGGGGQGGNSISGSISTGEDKALNASIGGSGGAGGFGGAVALSIGDDVSTSGDNAGGVLAQSIGGGGGNGGTAISGEINFSKSTTLELGLGGVGASGNSAGAIRASSTDADGNARGVFGDVTTSGDQSDGIVAQSIGGGGGTGGYAISANISTSATKNLGVSLGGDGGSGGRGREVALDVTGAIGVTGAGSRGIVAQSIGGGGGSGGMAVTGTFSTSDDTKAVSVDLGGAAGNGSPGGLVSVKSEKSISTGGETSSTARVNEHGLVAQSIGGGGGTGGFVANGNANSDNNGNQSLGVTIGGKGGSGATSDTVKVENLGTINTANATSHGILAQSIAGGGGDGGSTTTFAATPSTSDDTKRSFSVGVGGQAGGGAAGGDVNVEQAGDITVLGAGSKGIVAQSIAGGGGTGGGNVFKNFTDGKLTDKTTNSVSVDVGGSGGAASNGGAVTLTTTEASTIKTGNSRTLADASVPSARYAGHGILLQSVGGGGGDGGIGLQGDVEPTGSEVGLDVGIGGKSGVGGAGGTVQAGSSDERLLGTIITSDPGSWGLLAQSIGGGGGTGGTGIDGDVSNGNSEGMSFGLGAKGGAGGSADAVEINSELSVQTDGDGSKGIVAQSIGGGGGAGGTGISGSISGGDDKDDTKQVSFGLGLAGGGGGSGGAVSITTVGRGTIETGKMAEGSSTAVSDGLTSADAIFAQSVGGGGGAGGVGIKGDISNSSKANAMSLNLGMGSDGGDGAKGGEVSVTNAQSLTATGASSRGIFAQSVGGGGGNGGIGLNGGITAPPDADSDKQVDFGLGGAGGTGGDGSKVFVSNSGEITTQRGSSSDLQVQMHGVFAQSVGGGGGNGAIGIKGDIKGSKTSKALNVAIGGAGGSSGVGAQGSITSNPVDAGVGVDNSNTISTIGDGSIGIFAQNIGGGGGNGAVGLGGTVDSGGGKAVEFSLGASGGGGGSGGTVFVNNSAQITTGASDTTDDPGLSQAHGIFAQSVGGGGGTGSHTGSLIYGSTSSGTEKGIAFTLGGTAGGGDGGDVKVIDSFGVATNYNASHGIFAQSVGGGGGLAGDLGGIGTDDGAVSNQWDAAISIGGQTTKNPAGTTSGGGDGGDISVEATGEAYGSKGDGAYGIIAQSIGGGGGTGGGGAGLSETQDDKQSTKNAKLAINVGGQMAAAGDGGLVDVTVGSDTEVTTAGTAAVAVLAQSVGGGGGIGGAGATGVTGSIVTIGGSDLASGDGENVTATIKGSIETAGAAGAHGVLAQSIGGGGGYGGTFDAEGAQFGVNSDISQGTDTAGTGGDVAVTASGSITTESDSSFGIFAQSIGGGGGIGGGADGEATTLVGTSGGNGAAGKVSVELDGGSIETSGGFSHAIVAQAAGGADDDSSGGAVVNLTGSTVEAKGSGAAGILAQSASSVGSASAVAITIDDASSVTGGAGTSSETSAAIIIQDGDDNTIDNEGDIVSANGASGIAVKYAGGSKVTVTNTGKITGNFAGNVSENAASSAPAIEISGTGSFGVLTNDETVEEGSATGIDIENQASGVIEMAGTGGFDELTNDGIVEVGGVGLFDELMGVGDVTTRDGGSLNFDLGFALGGMGMMSDQSDKIMSSGTYTFEAGASIGINVVGNYRPSTDSLFELIVAEELIFDSEDALLSILDAPLLPASDWTLVLDGVSSFDPDFGVSSAAGVGTTLSLKYIGGPVPVPVPPAFLLYLSVIGGCAYALRKKAGVVAKS
ncbi:MAG: hypothetical protein AAGP08_02180 [Pseudomonadota bacterium]